MNKSVEEIYNRVINHAINLGLEADQFLRCWNEGDWNGCREFDFEPDVESANPIFKDELDDDHPLCLVNGQIEDLLEGVGASEDHEDVIKFLLDTGLPRSTVDRIHKAIVWGDTKVRPVNRRDLHSILRTVQDFEISCSRAIELIDLAEVGKLRNEDFPGEPKNLFNEDDIPVDLYIEAKRKADLYDQSSPEMKPHLFRDMINGLRDVAIQFHAHDSLRERLRSVVDQHIQVQP